MIKNLGLTNSDLGTVTLHDSVNPWLLVGRHGFVDNSETSISFNDANYTFTLTDAGAGWRYIRNGKIYTISGSKTVVIPGAPPATNVYYIYIDDNIGTLTASTVSWNLIDSKLPVAILIWDNTLTPKYWIADERHTCLIDRREHCYNHITKGTQLVSGGNLSGYSTASSSNANNTFGVSETTIADEDLFHTLAALSDENGSGTPYVILYRTGTSSYAWKKSAVPYDYAPSGYIRYDNSGSMTEGSNARYYNYYLIYTNLIGDARYMLIPGRGSYASAASAYAEDVRGFTFGGIPLAEFVIAYQLTFVSNSSYTALGKCKLERNPQRLNITYTQSLTTPSPGAIQFIIPVDSSLSVSTGNLRFYNQTGRTLTISEVFLAVSVAPVGSAIIADINKNGVTIFTNQANRPQILDGQNTGYSTTVDVPSLLDGDYLTLDIDAVGSGSAAPQSPGVEPGTAGSYLTAHIVCH